MIKVFALLSLSVTLLVAAIALGIGFPPAAVRAQEESSRTCHVQAVPMDEGYGVTQTVMRQVCGRSH